MLNDTKRQVINLQNCCIWLVNLFEVYDDAPTCQRQIHSRSCSMDTRNWNLFTIGDKIKQNVSGSNAKEDDGRKTVYRTKERKNSFEIDGWMTL